jgi:hypothetical protein
MAILLVTCSQDKLAGTTDETLSGTQAKAMIYYANGAPVPGAKVKVFDINDTSRIPIIQTITDSNGHYSFTEKLDGTFNIWSEKDSLVAFQDSVLITSTSNTIHHDTVRASGSITAIVGMQPNDDPRSAYIQVLGSERYSNNVGIDGYFTLAGLATGKYNIRISTTQPNYTPTFFTLSARSGKNDTLKDTLWLIYTGIPVVTGMKASYDTLNGIVHLSWSKASYRDFQDYLIFRDPYDSINLSTIPVAARPDTSFADSIFKRGLASRQFSFTDTNDYHFKYRVSIRNNLNKAGETYKFVDVVAASPTKAKTTISFTTYHLAKGFYTDSASVNDTILYTVQINNPSRNLRSLSWKDLSKNTIIRSKNLDTTINDGWDTVKYSWGELGQKGLECTVIDMAGAVWKDTVVVNIIQDKPTVILTTSTPEVDIRHAIHLHAAAIDQFGKIIKWEWSAGDSVHFIKSSIGDTIITAPSIENLNYPVYVRVTDDDGNMASASIRIKVHLNPPIADAGQDTVVGVNDTIRLHAKGTDDSKIIKYEWKIGSGNWVETKSIDTLFIAPSTPQMVLCSLKVTDDDSLTAVDAVSIKISLLTVKWQFNFPTTEYECCPGQIIVGDDGTIYAQTTTTLWAINFLGLKWACSSFSIGFPAIGNDGTIYMPSYSLDARSKNGSQMWSYDSLQGFPCFLPPAIGSDGTIFICNSKSLFAITPDGTRKWTYTPFSGAIAICSDGTIYGGSKNGLVAIGPDGTKKWETPPECYNPVIGNDGTIYAIGNEKLCAFNSASSFKWEFSFDTANLYSSPAIGVDGTIYVPANGNKLLAVSSNGTLKWEFLGDHEFTTPVIGNNGEIYATGFSGKKLYIINSNGIQEDVFSFQDSLAARPAPIMGNDGTIYLISGSYYYSNKTTVYAIKTPSSGPANSSWPMFRQNSRGTGRVPD